MSRPILVTSYTRPDLDGFGGAWAYTELLNQQGKSAVAQFFDQPRGEEQYVMKLFGGTYPAILPNDADFDQVILVDSSDMGGFDGLLTPSKVVEVIDHRSYTDRVVFPNALFELEAVGAAATLIAERWYAFCHSWADPALAGIDTENPGIHGSSIRNSPARRDFPVKDDRQIKPTPLSAALLLGGIISNTQNFQANVTTERDHAMADWLRSQLDLPPDFVTHLFEGKSDLADSKLGNRLNGETALFEIAGLRLMIGQIEMIGVQELVDERRSDLVAELHRLTTERHADRMFLSLLDVGGNFNLFIADDVPTQELLSTTLQVKFNGPIARRDGVIMRKEIVPKLKTYLEAQ